MNDSTAVTTFVDTNILVYAHDRDAGARHERAAECIATLWEHQNGSISTQVLQEFYVTVTRKIPNPVIASRARSIIRLYGQWGLVTNDLETILQACEFQEKHLLSFWDAMIIAAAVRGGAEILLTEDLNDGQLIEGVRVVNPFSNV